MRAVQRITGYCLLRDGGGAVALVRPTGGAGTAAHWSLPGGAVLHGEHPREAAVRAAGGQLGVRLAPGRLHSAATDVVELRASGESLHTLRLVYEATAAQGSARGEPVEPVEPVEPAEPAELVEPGRLTTLPLAPFTARALGLPAPPAPPAPPALPAGPAVPVAAGPAVPVAPQAADGGVPQVQRSGAYAVCVQDVVPAVGPPSPAVPSVLLARFVGNGEWTLPGGGIDHGEQPEDAVLREVYEETGLALSGPRLLDVLSVHFTGRAPGGRQEDFHAVRVVFTGTVPTDEPPHVTELDGTTDAAAWVPLARLGDRPVSELARTALRQVLAPSRPAGGP